MTLITDKTTTGNLTSTCGQVGSQMLIQNEEVHLFSFVCARKGQAPSAPVQSTPKLQRRAST